MSDCINKNRRNALKLAAAGAVAVPLSMLTSGKVFAEGLPPVDPASSAAVALKYVADATKAERAEKAGTPGDQQFCYNCQFAPTHEGDFLPCQLFPANTVAKDGWCSAWAMMQK